MLKQSDIIKKINELGIKLSEVKSSQKITLLSLQDELDLLISDLYPVRLEPKSNRKHKKIDLKPLYATSKYTGFKGKVVCYKADINGLEQMLIQPECSNVNQFINPVWFYVDDLTITGGENE